MNARTRQRLLVSIAVLVLVLVSAFAPLTRPETARAAAAVACGTNDANRASLLLADGTRVTPCLSKVNLNVSITGGFGSYNIYKIVFPEGFGTVPLKYVDGTVENLYHLTFQSFKINSTAKLVARPGSGGPPYTLSITPDTAATIGGTGVNTDLWVTGSSTVVLSFIGCNSFAVSTAASLSWLINGSSWTGCAANLDVRYATAYVPGAATQGVYPFKLPDTTIAVS